MWRTLAASAMVGGLIGGLVQPFWTHNVESAQVVAGVVQLPQDNPMLLVHTRVYSALIQGAAVLLRLGMSEWGVSVVSSMLEGSLAFAAVAACALSVSGRPLVSLLTPTLFLAWGERAGQATTYAGMFNGHTYPVHFPTTSSVYGHVGLYLVLLIFSLAALGKIRIAAVMAGLAPAIHPTLAAACWLGLAFAIGSDWPAVRAAVRRAAPYFLGGLLVFAVSLGWHLAEGYFPSAGGLAGHRPLTDAFATYWMDHQVRRLSELRMLEVDLYLVLLATVLLRRWPSELPRDGRLLVKALLAITLIGGAYTIVAAAFSAAMSPLLRTLLITRWLNLNSVALPALVLGLLGLCACRRANRTAAIALVTASALVAVDITGWTSVYAYASEARTLGGVTVAGLIRSLCLPALVFACAWVIGTPARPTPLLRLGALWQRTLRVSLALVIAGVLVRQAAALDRERVMGEDADTPIMARARTGTGLLLVGYDLDVDAVQERTRRGVLRDLHQVSPSYVPEAAEAFEHLLQRVYGLSLLDQRGMDALHSTAPNWQARTLVEWQVLRAEFDITEVLVARGTVLQLPQVMNSDRLTLFGIPENR